jgi:hypothetical protein
VSIYKIGPLIVFWKGADVINVYVYSGAIGGVDNDTMS